MPSETTQAGPAARAAVAGALDPGALFTLEEAAGRVRVPVEDLEARCDRGELLFETRRRGRKEVRCVRGLDLMEAFPGAPVGAGASEGPGATSGSSGPAGRRPPAEALRPGAPVSGAASGAVSGAASAPVEHAAAAAPGAAGSPVEPPAVDPTDRRPSTVSPPSVPAEDSAAGSAAGSAGDASGTVEASVRSKATAQESLAAPRSRPGGADGIAEAVRSSGASRDALIGLCQDLETRLDLAERERQASTASLLMAQRRVLDLELQGRSGSWVRAGGAALGLMSISALAVMAMLPGWLDDRASGREASQSAQLTAELGRLEVSMGTLAAASGEERAALAARLDARTDALERSRSRAAQLTAEASVDRAQAEAARLASAEQLRELEDRLVAADRQAVRRGAELEIIVESSARDRARFDERLAAAERDAVAARAALDDARVRSVEDRQAFERQRVAAEEERAAQHALRALETEALRAEIRGLMVELESGQEQAVAALEAVGAGLREQLEDGASLKDGAVAESPGPQADAAPAWIMPLPQVATGPWWVQVLRSVTRG